MKTSIALILASAALFSSSAAYAKTAPCHDAKGHFTKCPPAVAHTTVTHTTVVHRVTHATVAASAGRPTAKCKDGSLSYSAHRSGTCSHHGGVASWS